MAVEHWTVRSNIRQQKDLLKSLSTLIVTAMQKRGSVRNPPYLDFRFLLLLSQWVAEQGGYSITPKGNNPGNVMGSGDLGTFLQPKNHEVVNGKSVLQPATFANYSSMAVGTSATLDQLSKKWPNAYSVLFKGGSAEAYGMGLYPGVGKNYATTSKGAYLNGLRFRIGNVITDYIAVYTDDIKQLNEYETGLGKGSSAAAQVQQGTQQAEMMKAVFNDTIRELKALELRFKQKKDLQPA